MSASCTSSIAKARTSTYFLLAVAASAVAFAIQKTENATMTWPLLPMGGAVLSFGLSFAYGVLTMLKVNTAVGANYALAQLSARQHERQPPEGAPLQGAISGVREAIDYSATRAQKYGARQLWWLIIGALLFVVWHVLQIYLRNASNAGGVVVEQKRNPALRCQRRGLGLAPGGAKVQGLPAELQEGLLLVLRLALVGRSSNIRVFWCGSWRQRSHCHGEAFALVECVPHSAYRGGRFFELLDRARTTREADEDHAL